MKIKKSQLLYFIKILVVIGLGSVLYFQILKNENWTDIKAMFLQQQQSSNIVYLILAILLMPLNWLLETTKWYFLVRTFEKITFLTAVKAILLGITMALITPARIGEYAGRLSILKEKSQSLGATLLGSIAQNLITLVVGLVAAYTFLNHFSGIGNDGRNVYILLVIIAILILVYVYFNLSKIILLLKKVRWTKVIASKFTHLENYTVTLLTTILGLSTLRYLVYTTQYFLLLIYFGITGDTYILLAGIAILFLIQSGIPLPPVLSILARGELAILIWNNISDNTIAAIAVSFTLWIINLIIPSLIGAIVMFRTKLFKDEREIVEI